MIIDHQYLSQLVILAQIVDDEFQQSIQKMYDIDKVTNEAMISFQNQFNVEEAKTSDDKHGDGILKYLRYHLNSCPFYISSLYQTS